METILFGANSTLTSAFEIALIGATSGTLTATMSFTTLSQYQGFVIGCGTTTTTPTSYRTVNVQGISIKPELLYLHIGLTKGRKFSCIA